MKKLIFIFFFLFFISLFIIFSFSNIKNVRAVGLSGVLRELVFFKPGLTRTYEYTVISNTDREMNHSIGVSGDLAKYFSLSTNVLRLKPGEEGKFTATMKLPYNLSSGRHHADICVLESQTRGNSSGGTGIGSRAAACAKIDVFVLYPGKYAEFTFTAGDTSVGGNAPFTLNVINFGEESFDAKADIDVFHNDKKITTVHTNEKHFESGMKNTLRASLNTTGLEIGEYNAKATLYYDGKNSTKEDSFKIGKLSLEILDYTKKVEQGKINLINIKVKNGWNKPIDDVYADLYINKNDNTEVTSLKTPSDKFNAWETKELNAYWNTKDVSFGEYNITITLHYAGETTTEKGNIKVVPVGILKSRKINIIILISLIALAIIALIVFLVLRKRKGMKRKKRIIVGRKKPKRKKKER